MHLRDALQVRPHMFKRLGVVCVMVAIDLGFTNMAISMLPLALQQCIAATTPAATVTIESVYEQRLQHPFIYTVIACLCAGAVLAELGSFGDAAGGGERNLRGELMMLMAVFAASCKYVFAKATVQEYRDELGSLAFLFWVEVTRTRTSTSTPTLTPTLPPTPTPDPRSSSCSSCCLGPPLTASWPPSPATRRTSRCGCRCVRALRSVAYASSPSC